MLPEWFTQGPAAELLVWRSLRTHLSDEWTVWHHLAYASAQTPTASQGEIDFLCYHPRRGLVLLEVKGGALSFEEGRWFQDGNVLKTSPFQQVAAASAALCAQLSACLSVKKLTFPIVKGVWFPSMMRLEEEPFEAAGLTLYAEDLIRPEAALLHLLGEASTSCEDAPSATQLQAWLSPTTSYTPQWQSRRTLADAQLLKLTMEQARTLDAFTQFPRLRVRGCAGSGKTLLAVRRAFQLIAEGKRVLLLCFNLLLAAHLRKVTGQPNGLRIEAVNDLFLDLLKRTPTADPEFWHDLARDVVPVAEQLAHDAPYDAVIVDEGQDFSPLVWTAVKALIPAQAQFIIFYDPEQNIFQRNLDAMPVFPWPEAVLTRNCRNTRLVCDALAAYAPAQMVVAEDAPTGEAPEEYTAESRTALRSRLLSLLDRLVAREGVPLEEIVVMGAHARNKMHLETVEAHYPALRYFTYRKFKGLEAPILILLDVSDNHPLWDRAARYTAISRAVHKLIILKLNKPSAQA